MAAKNRSDVRDVYCQPAEVMPDKKECAHCIAWKPKKNQTLPVWGGCARGGTTTLHYGDVAYNHYTTDLNSCSAWEAK